MGFKVSFLIISLLTAVLGIVCVSNLPNDRLSRDGNYWRISIFSNLSSALDIVMFWIVVSLMPDGEYGTGIEVIAFCAVLLFYGIPCVVCSCKLKRKIKRMGDDVFKLNKINGLNVSVIIKAMFFLVETIWIVEG